MELRMWTLDLAREQAPTLDHLYQYAALTQDAGYDALGLYLEHRFAYPSLPWAQGQGCVTPEMVRALRSEFPSLQVVPFVNLLGHMEGFLNAEEGRRYREERFAGMQACPCKPEVRALAESLLDDTLAAFDSQIVHIGGDETWQLGACDACKAFVEAHGKAELYGRHFGPLAERVAAAGRTPAVWGDMFLEHPEALAHMPRETVVFDWQYFSGVAETSEKFGGLRVVGCPTLHVYNAPWFHLQQSEDNCREVFRDSQSLYGACLTTWECGLTGAYDTLFPAVRQAAALMSDPDGAGFLDAFGESAEWARLMGVELERLGGVFGFSGHRNKLKSRALLYNNPFLASHHHGEELSGKAGDGALRILDHAGLAASGEAEKGVVTAVRGLVEFVRLAHEASLRYAEGEAEDAIGRLTATRTVFDLVRRAAVRTHQRTGGSLADIERCRLAVRHVDEVIVRVRSFGRRQLGYLPAWDVITHPNFVAHDQACWWLVNKWGRE
jgi:hypothetical protein